MIHLHAPREHGAQAPPAVRAAIAIAKALTFPLFPAVLVLLVVGSVLQGLLNWVFELRAWKRYQSMEWVSNIAFEWFVTCHGVFDTPVQGGYYDCFPIL